MTAPGAHPATAWQDPSFAMKWASNDAIADLLAPPRSIAAAVIADDRPEVTTVVDVGSGPGDFLAALLSEFPSARGLWTDVSEAMRELAEANLGGFRGRVDFTIADMTALGAAVPFGVDVIITSRAAHHLDRNELFAFYAETAAHLAPGGWLANLDHVGSASDVWDARLRRVRKRFHRAGRESPKHHHHYPLTGLQDHLDALHGAGFDDVEVVWRAFYTCLFMARAPG
jgi:SAM-dependent methyltransferase